MFELFEDSAYVDEAYGYFSVLHEGYFEDQWRECMRDMQRTFDSLYETRFIIVDRESGNPVNVNAVLKDRKTAEELLKIIGKDTNEIAMLVLEV